MVPRIHLDDPLAGQPALPPRGAAGPVTGRGQLAFAFALAFALSFSFSFSFALSFSFAFSLRTMRRHIEGRLALPFPGPSVVPLALAFALPP